MNPIKKISSELENLSYHFIPSSIGTLLVVFCSKGLCSLSPYFPKVENTPCLPYNDKLLTLRKNLNSLSIEDILGSKVDLCSNATSFDIEVWNAARQIPFGKTLCYQDLARQIQRPKAFRAVAKALGNNPFFYLIPCHRIICKNGDLGGYRWGIRLKKKILDSVVKL